MRLRVPASRPARGRAGVVLSLAAALGLLTALGACGSGLRGSARADVDASSQGTCAGTVLEALGHVAARVYREGVLSERTATATHLIDVSAPLRAAVEADDAGASAAAARALVASGHLTNLRVVRGGHVLADVGGPALAPLAGTLKDARGKPLASFVTSVWSDSGLVAETNGIAAGVTTVRSGDRVLAGSAQLPSGKLPVAGTLTSRGVAYQYVSYPGAAYPDAAPVRVYVLRPIDTTAALCGASSQETLVNTISHIAHLIYDGEAGRRTLTQIHRVQANRALLQAVARRDPTAARAAVAALLHQHIVRLRVSAGSQLLADVGGPFVLAPVTAPLRLGGRTIGSLVLSIQDDEGYKRLAGRLAGLDVLMYMGTRLVKSTLGAAPGPIATSGPVSYRGKSFSAYTFNAEAFPSGPLRITVLIPIPYT